MPVYVDNMKAPFGRLIMCHMYADDHFELLAMAHAIGVAQRWIQKPFTYQEHFDICKSKRALAVKAGAKEVSMHDYAIFMKARREQEQHDRRTTMTCTVCNKVLSECTCPDREQRMREASDGDYFATKWCVTCDKAYHFCKCEKPNFMMRTGGKILPLPEQVKP